MTVYAWPSFPVARFELRLMPNVRAFVGPYTPSTQVIDLLGERWSVRIDLPPPRTRIEGAAREAFFDRLKGPTHQFSIWHMRLPAPQGTLRSDTAAATWLNNASAVATWLNNASAAAAWYAGGAPFVRSDMAQGANAGTVQTLAGKTVRAGDMLGLGVPGASGYQLVRIMADATANGAGLLSIEFQPRVRASSISQGTAVTWAAPTANFMLKSADGVPTSWVPGYAEGASFEGIEVY